MPKWVLVAWSDPEGKDAIIQPSPDGNAMVFNSIVDAVKYGDGITENFQPVLLYPWNPLK